MNYNLNPEEIEEIAFGSIPTPETNLPIEDLEGFSWEIRDSKLSTWEGTIILNMASLLSKVSIINSKWTLIRHRPLMSFLNFSNSRLTHLVLENIDFNILEYSKTSGLKNGEEYNYILNEYLQNEID